MSSYSSLSRVLSPFRVQTKFEEKTLPSSHIFKMRKALTCFVMGESFDEFTIVVGDEITIDGTSVPIKDFTVDLLKKHIWKNILKKFEGYGIEPSELNLWKAEIPISEENDEILKNPKIEDIIQAFNLKNLRPKKLRPGNSFLDKSVFPDDYAPPQDHIHILVQPPPPPATTEPPMKKRRLWKENPKKRSVFQSSSNEVRQVPISQSEFTLVRENRLLYVDKTYWLSKLNLNCGYYFVSRPRKFGKSMFLSMIESFFLVQRDLFNGLYVYENPPKINVESAEKVWDKDLPPIPVIRLDFSKLTSNEGPDVLKKELIQSLKSIGKIYDITLEYDTVKSVTEELITALADHQENVYRKVVILIDEYDFPILSIFNATKESLEIADKNHEILKGFFEVIKALQSKVKFLLVTGVTMFAQLGLFSGANNLDDVTISSVLSGAYGFTYKEIERTFGSLLTRSRYSMEDLRKKYNGYSWDCDVKVYNPYSICMFFNKLELENHWIQKGKTSFLAKLIDMKHVKNIVGEITIKKRSIVPVNIEAIQNSFDPPVPLLFQTGYLTIKQQKVDDDNDICFILEIPNTEVKESLMSELWANLDNISIGTACDRIQRLAVLLKEDKFIEFMIKFNYDLASIPYNESQYAGKYEGFYHSHVHMLVRYIGLPFRSEDATSRGRTDMWITTRTAVYYIEYKRYTRKTIDDQIIGNLIQEAIEQIFTTEYYASNTELHTKTQYAIGCIFSTESRKICGVGIQEFDLGSGIVNKKQLKNFINEFSPAGE